MLLLSERDVFESPVRVVDLLELFIEGREGHGMVFAEGDEGLVVETLFVGRQVGLFVQVLFELVVLGGVDTLVRCSALLLELLHVDDLVEV